MLKHKITLVVLYMLEVLAFTAGYWVLYKFKPQIICYTGCDMVYTGEKTHFMEKEKQTTLRKDKTLNNLLAKSARLEAIAFLNKCKILTYQIYWKATLLFIK